MRWFWWFSADGGMMPLAMYIYGPVMSIMRIPRRRHLTMASQHPDAFEIHHVSCIILGFVQYKIS